MKRLVIVVAAVALIAWGLGCGEVSNGAGYELTMAVAPAGSGNVADLTDASPYVAGTGVSIKAVADPGYHFVNWTASAGEFTDASAAETTFTMPTQDVTITANFRPFAGGSGTEGDPYQIVDWYQLHNVRDYLDSYFILIDDLDSTTFGYEERSSAVVNDGKGWEPIGSLDNPFIGSFDGQTHEIRNLLIRRPSGDWVGLFGCVGSGGVVKNLSLVNLEVVGNSYIGGMAGQIKYGTVKECQSTGSVAGDSCVGGLVGVNGIGGVIWDTYSACCVSGNLSVGGLVGDNFNGSVSNSYCSANVSGEDRVGGLVGDNILGTVSCSYSTGTVTGEVSVGGLVGYNYQLSIVTDCYSTGNVAGNQSTGGLVGYNRGGIIDKCYSVGGVTGDSSVGGLVGFSDPPDATASFWDAETSGCADSDGGTAKTTSEMRDVLTFSRIGWNIVRVARDERNEAHTWNIVDGQRYPFLSWEPIS